MNNLELKKICKDLGMRFPIAQMNRDLGYSKGMISDYYNGKQEISSKFEETFKDFYKINELIEQKQKSIPEGELTEKTYKGKTPVKIVSTNAQAGWSESYYSKEYLKDMPTVLIDTDENYRGNYMAFEVKGESMEPEYYEGDIVICREVQRHLWNYKLHYKDWDFVIAHGTKGIMLKEITNHDVEKGIITCHSLHPNHEDFKIDLHQVAFLYNVVEVRQKGKNKKRNR